MIEQTGCNKYSSSSREHLNTEVAALRRARRPGRQPWPRLRLRSLHPPVEGVHCYRLRVCLLSPTRLVGGSGRLAPLAPPRKFLLSRASRWSPLCWTGRHRSDGCRLQRPTRSTPRALVQRLRRRREQPQLHPNSLQAWRLAGCHGNVPTLYRFISGKITAAFSKQRQCRVRRVGCLGYPMFTAGGNLLRRAAIYHSTDGGAWRTAMLGYATSSSRRHLKCGTHHTRVGYSYSLRPHSS